MTNGPYLDFRKLSYGDPSETLKFAILLEASRQADKLTTEPLDDSE